MKLKEIRRTSTFAWSPASPVPLLATGTVAGALDESFSNESQLEIWEPDFLNTNELILGADAQQYGPKGVVTDTARFNRLAWSFADTTRTQGILAAGMENGELVLWDAHKIITGAGNAESLIQRNSTHTGPIRGLDFNPVAPNLLSSGGVNGEVYVWDMKDPSHPYSPGTRSTKLDEITSVAWNSQVQHVLAGASTTGYTVVWDLRGKREVVALAYGGGTGTLAGQHVGSMNGLAVGGRRGMSDIAWHPDNATRLVTASEDDSSPIIMVWDLRNARAPEKILTGHEKGVLSLSWCKQDADLLLSCGKDNRALCWNPQTSEIIGELPSAANWAFQVDWCPRNPSLLATAFFDGTIGIHSIQSTNEASSSAPAGASLAPIPDGAGLFDSPSFGTSNEFQSNGTFSLKQPPKWLRRPISASLGFGGKLVSVSNHGKPQVQIRNVVTEPELVERARKLRDAMEADKLNELAEERVGASNTGSKEGSKDSWKALLSLFRANSRDELVTLLGFSKEEVAVRVSEAVERLKVVAASEAVADDLSAGNRPVVSFVEPEREGSPEPTGSDGDDDEGSVEGGEKTPSEVSTSVVSDVSGVTRHDAESTTTNAPSLFGDEDPGTPQMDAGADFFSTLGLNMGDDGRPPVVPHTSYGLDSSVAATIGSGPSSVASESLKNNTFKIYPKEESETDRLVTKALVLGDFESAVSLCLSSERFADAILLAVKGGPDLLQRTQKAYFERRTTLLPYLRLFQSIVTNDLADIVQNADLQEWQEIFVVMCTFATPDEFSGLAEQLGRRLEFEFTVSASSEDKGVASKAPEYRKHATLAYLAAGKLERLINIWIDELSEEEQALNRDEGGRDGSHYSVHVQALQSFIEKVTVFRSAIKYIDADLSQSVSPSPESTSGYKLSGLYERYVEYAEVLAAQGLVREASSFVQLTPKEYHAAVAGAEVQTTSNRAPAPSQVASSSNTRVAALATTTSQPSVYTPYNTYTAPVQHATAPVAQGAGAQVPVPYNPYALPPVTNPVPPAPGPQQYAPVQQTQQYVSPVNNYNAYNNNNLSTPPHLRAQPGPTTPLAPAQRVPPPPKRDNGGWNDAPAVAPARTASATANVHKPAAITSPFPNAPASPGFSPLIPGQTLPPPPRPGSVQAQTPPMRSGPPVTTFPPPPPAGRPPSGLGHTMPPPPQRMMSPQGPPPMQQQHNPYAAPPARAPVSGQTPPPPSGPYARPPQGAPQSAGGPGPYQAPPNGGPAQNSPYAPPPAASPYAPPPQQQPQQPQHSMSPQGSQFTGAPPPPQSGPYGPPPMARVGSSNAPPPPPGGPGGPPPRAPSTSAPPPKPAKAQPPPPKYPPGDRSHIPDHVRSTFEIIVGQLDHMRKTTPPQQKRLVDDLERRLNPLFDALNCETLSQGVVDQLIVLGQAMAAHDRPAALAIHVDLLTRGSQTDDIGLWMSGLKQLILRL